MGFGNLPKVLVIGRVDSDHDFLVASPKSPWSPSEFVLNSLLRPSQTMQERRQTVTFSGGLVEMDYTGIIFTDFLDMAKHLLEAEYKDPSASLVGAVLEDGLRKICEIHSVQVKGSDDIGALNTKLADKEVYNRLVQKQIQAWKAIRNSADHGKFDDYKKEDVAAMLQGVQRFLTENL